jgi:hypothetical protein
MHLWWQTWVLGWGSVPNYQLWNCGISVCLVLLVKTLNVMNTTFTLPQKWILSFNNVGRSQKTIGTDNILQISHRTYQNSKNVIVKWLLDQMEYFRLTTRNLGRETFELGHTGWNRCHICNCENISWPSYLLWCIMDHLVRKYQCFNMPFKTNVNVQINACTNHIHVSKA